MPEKLHPSLLNSRHAEMISARRFFLLFIFLLGSLILYPYADGNGSRYYLFRFLTSTVILLSVYAVSFRRSLVLFALVLAVPALLQHLFVRDFDASAFAIIRVSLTFVFEVFIIVVIFRRVFSRKEANAETVFGALCIYLLVGFSFASIYSLISDVRPGALYLDPLTNNHSILIRSDFIYYSFGTLTSLGAAGITPVSAEVRSVTIIEGILGVLYLAVLISRLMGAYRSHNSAAQPD